MKPHSLAMTSAVLAAALLAACGGGGGDPAPGNPPPDTNRFTQSADWSFMLPAAGTSLCYDFDTKAEVAGCTGSAWDLKVTSGGRSATLWTNSGTSGAGGGGAFGGPFDRDWSTLSAWMDATVDPVDGALPSAVYFKDATMGAFSGTNAIKAAAFEYDLAGDHQLYPNYRVFLITTDSASADAVGTAAAPVFALQFTGYYGGAGGVASGHPSFRWVDRSAPGTAHEATVDASSSTAWVYFNLVSGTEVGAGGAWHIAFNRYNVKLNGGDSGTGNVAGFVGKTPTGFYDVNGNPVVDRFRTAKPADTLADLTAADMAVPAAASDWATDTNASELNAAYRGTYPDVLDFGWYRYYPSAAAASAAGLPATAHLLAANPTGAALLRSGEGQSYARLHVTEIRYADPAVSSSAQTWTIHFDVQPKP